jgi:flagellar protein FliL
MEKKFPAGMIVGIALASACASASATWLFTRKSPATVSASPVTPLPDRGQIVKLEGFTVNLADSEASHFLRTTLALEVAEIPGANKEKPEATLPIARIRDVILSVLTSSKAEPLLTSEGKLQLKKSILAKLKSEVPELGVRDVYFTEFLVQR